MQKSDFCLHHSYAKGSSSCNSNQQAQTSLRRTRKFSSNGTMQPFCIWVRLSSRNLAIRQFGGSATNVLTGICISGRHEQTSEVMAHNVTVLRHKTLQAQFPCHQGSKSCSFLGPCQKWFRCRHGPGSKRSASSLALLSMQA